MYYYLCDKGVVSPGDMDICASTYLTETMPMRTCDCWLKQAVGTEVDRVHSSSTDLLTILFVKR